LRCDFGEDVRRRLEIERHGSIALDLLLRCTANAEIGNGRGGDNNTCLRQSRENRISHFVRRLYLNRLNISRRLKCDRTGKEDHLRPSPGGGFSQRVPHLAARTISKKTN